MGSRWVRVRHNGYRDMASDTECFGAFNPEYAWYRANKQLMELAALIERDDLIEKHTAMGEDMRSKIEEYGWDGEYYITAINDKGEKIGFKESKEGNMYLNPQLWAVFSGIAPKEKLEALMKTVDENLETHLGTLVNNPGYNDPWRGNWQ